MVARRAHNPKVTGSSPVPATKLYADVAQSVERILGKDKVTGSIPVISSISYFIYGGVAQLARAFGSYPKGPGFKSLRRHQKKDVDIRLLLLYSNRCYWNRICNKNAGIAQLVEHLTCNEDVAGSSPVSSSISFIWMGSRVAKGSRL